MITSTPGPSGRIRLVGVAVAAALLAACAAAPLKPSGADEVRAKLTRLQSDPKLANRAPAATAEAEAAVRDAEQPQSDASLGAYRVYIADRKVGIASAEAQTRYYEDERAALTARQQDDRLAARTREADVARNQAAAASADADAQRQDARQARSDADAANATAAGLSDQAAELQRQIDALNVRVTDRGLVLTLGDVLFDTGQSALHAGNVAHLDKLVWFLNHYPDRTAVIEGYTDSVGSAASNQVLSEARAGSVRHYLLEQGIDAGRLSASGMGQGNPIADNGSASGRQQNRRVEIVISNPAAASH